MVRRIRRHLMATFETPALFMKKTDQVFVRDGATFAVKIFDCNVPMNQLIHYKLRFWATYEDDDIVERCAEHSDGSGRLNGILRCPFIEANYVTYLGHPSIVIPLNILASGSKAFEPAIHLQFVCQSTCSSIDRHPLKLHMALENTSGGAVCLRQYRVTLSQCPACISSRPRKACSLVIGNIW